jgi:F0F1-type ATP synthase epsilon subunit
MSDDAKPVMRQDASTGEMVEDKAATAEAGKNADSKKPIMAIKVYAPFQIYFDGEGYSISGVNETGPFDILPHHHNFLCMLVPCELVIKTPYDTKRIKISRALMHVKAEKVTVFVDV